MQADLDVINSTRVEVCFRRGGWIDPRFPGIGQVSLLRDVRQIFPAWLDMTVLDLKLRICRGNAGTTFALLKRSASEVLKNYWSDLLVENAVRCYKYLQCWMVVIGFARSYCKD